MKVLAWSIDLNGTKNNIIPAYPYPTCMREWKILITYTQVVSKKDDGPIQHWFRQHLEILILRFFCYWSPDVTGRLKPNCCIACVLIRPQFQHKKTRRDQTAPNLGPKTSWTNMTFFWFYTQWFLNGEGSTKHILKTAMTSPYPNQHSSRQYKLEETILPGKWLTHELIRSKTSAFSGTRSR